MIRVIIRDEENPEEDLWSGNMSFIPREGEMVFFSAFYGKVANVNHVFDDPTLPPGHVVTIYIHLE